MSVAHSIGIGHFQPQMYRYRIGSEKGVSVHHYHPLSFSLSKQKDNMVTQYPHLIIAHILICLSHPPLATCSPLVLQSH